MRSLFLGVVAALLTITAIASLFTRHKHLSSSTWSLGRPALRGFEMSCNLVAAGFVLAWCASQGPVHHYKVFRSDDPVNPVGVTNGAEPKFSPPCEAGAFTYHAIAYSQDGDPTEWAQWAGPASIDSEVYFCDAGMDANGDGTIGGEDFGAFSQAFGCTMKEPAPALECE